MPAEPSAASQIDTLKSYLRREYAGKLAELKQYAREVFASSTNQIVITSTSFEGGSTGAQLSFTKILLLQAIEAVITEIDPDYGAPVVIPRREIGTTVRLCR